MLCVITLNAYGQQVRFIATDAPQKFRVKVPRALLTDSVQAKQAAMEYTLTHLFSMGYLAATVDSVSVQQSYTLYGALSEKYKWGSVSITPEVELLSRQSRSGLRHLHNQVISPLGLQKGVERIISHLENSGYPFGKVWFDSVQL
ncbi:MAG TPA: hypothetical protein PLC17_08745, partial [Tenuifilaceae bacterium]|nr:hypothetical protein [Tenuifilaceae bacterium]